MERMKTLLFSLLLISTQTTLAHEDCVFNNAPIGSMMAQKMSSKSTDAIIGATIKAKEKFDEILNLFNKNSSRNIRVLSAVSSESSVEKPLIYSPKLIAQDLEKLKAQMSPALKSAIFSDDGRIDMSRISEVDLIKFGPQISGLYDLAIRYDLLIKNKSAYIQRANKDIRGVYYLYQNNIKANNLVNLNDYSTNQQSKIKEALIGICRNSNVKTSSCKRELETSINRKTVHTFYQKYYNQAVTVWNSYYLIPEDAKRKDITFRNGILELPFKMPESKQVHDFVLEIEKFWKKNDFAINLDLQDKGNIPNLSFKENSVAHVNRLGGNDIIMNTGIDMNIDHNKKILNHEFGHVLGLPDCYIEFYDETQEAFVNYQLDKSDFMCSTSGKLTPRIIQELKRVYGN